MAWPVIIHKSVRGCRKPVEHLAEALKANML